MVVPYLRIGDADWNYELTRRNTKVFFFVIFVCVHGELFIFPAEASWQKLLRPDVRGRNCLVLEEMTALLSQVVLTSCHF